MEAIKILHTNSGVGHDSYANNSLLQVFFFLFSFYIFKIHTAFALNFFYLFIYLFIYDCDAISKRQYP